MLVINSNELKESNRQVNCPNGGFISLRILLEEDKMGYTMTRTLIPKNDKPQFWHYKNHLETCFCIKGRGVLTNTLTNKEFIIVPGVV